MNHSKQQNLFDRDTPGLQPMPWESAAGQDRLAAAVVFNRPLETVFYYDVPDALRPIIGPGRRVRVPFGKGDRLTLGYCVGLAPPPTERPLKSVESILDRDALLSPEMLELTRWIARRYLSSWGQVLVSVVPAGVKKKAGTRLLTYFRAGEGASAGLADRNLPAKQRAVLESLIAAGAPLRGEELAERAGCGTSPIGALRKKGLIVASRQRTGHDSKSRAAPARAGAGTDRRLVRPGSEEGGDFLGDLTPVKPVEDFQLKGDQRKALEAIVSILRAGEHRTVLLHGVTGSGKTEVYIQAIREVVGYGRQAIVLVPEISLTPQTIRRFRSRFDSVAVLHSHLSDSERHWHWQQIARGAVQVVVGARSAVFAPMKHLGMIVVDEEHETTFKQETTPRYHAVDVARKRAEIGRVPLVLGSATPRLESWLRVTRKQDVLASLPARVEKLPLPPVVVVDIRNDPNCSRGERIGRALQSAMRLALREGGQVILFLNLRGFSPALWCRACGQSIRCPSCDITLTWHKDRNVALCHFCEYTTAKPQRCPHCTRGGIRYVGFGTQRLEEEVRAKFPGYKVLRMDSDSMRRAGSHDRALDAFRSGEVQILLGTQMIAKGLDFPNVTLVGVVDADTLLHQPDLRAAERTFQLLAQVSGRTGRSTRGGRVFVQSATPTEPAIQNAAEHNFHAFAERELRHRRETHSPPFTRLARVIIRGPDEAAVKRQAKRFGDLLRETAEEIGSPVSILGPAPAPLAKLKRNYRYHLQLSAEDSAHSRFSPIRSQKAGDERSLSDVENKTPSRCIEPIHELWRQIADRLPKAKGIEYVVDVDPINMR